MTFHDISRFSIYQQLNSRTTRQKPEAMSIYPFLIGIQDFIEVNDVIYGEPDPPDFVMVGANKRVGIEMTLSIDVLSKVVIQGMENSGSGKTRRRESLNECMFSTGANIG